MKNFLSLCALCWGVSAQAQSTVAIDAELFNPSIGEGFFGVPGAESLQHLAFKLGFFVNFADDPLVVFNTKEDLVVLSPVHRQSALDLSAAIGINRLGELGISMPVALVQSGDDLALLGGSGSISGGKPGDLRLAYKRQLFQRSGFLLAGDAQLKLPTGSGENFFGSDSLPFLVGVLAQESASDLSLGLSVAFQSRPSVTLGDITLSRDLRLGLGASYLLNKKILATAEVESVVSLDPGSAGHAPTELRAGAKLNLAEDLWLPLGVGVGLNSGIGAPDLRLLLGVLYSPPSPDPDADGIKYSADKCPNDPEDKDSFEDANGCPELDNDSDGIVDKNDKCQNDAEDKDGFEDSDGCPELDNDKDGIADAADKCVVDAEDKDSFEDEDGCPELDNDKDGIVDKSDKCQNEAEDIDKFEDSDGCPELDNDKDSFADAVDQCPNEAETFNTPFDRKGEDGDGCPDADAVVALGKIKIKDRVFFDFGKATLQKKSNTVLDAVAKVMQDHPEIGKIRIEGHTDDIADEGTNQSLSEERAKAVLEYLVKKGVERERLDAVGYGKSKPLVSVDGLTGQALEDAREQNRRVEFSIVQ